jgi:hypothetical protein
MENGEKVLNEEYEFYNVFQKTIFATRNNKQFLIELEDAKYNEKEVSVDEFVKFKDEQEFPKNANQIFKSKGKFGVINYENKIVIPCEYESIENIYLSKEFRSENDRYCDPSPVNHSLQIFQFQAEDHYQRCVSYIEKDAETGLSLAKLDLTRQVPELEQLFFNSLLLVSTISR